MPEGGRVSCLLLLLGGGGVTRSNPTPRPRLPGLQEVEQAVAGVRADKVKADRQKAAVKTKKNLNVGRSGLSAGLDDYVYAAADDDDDFM